MSASKNGEDSKAVRGPVEVPVVLELICGESDLHGCKDQRDEDGGGGCPVIKTSVGLLGVRVGLNRVFRNETEV